MVRKITGVIEKVKNLGNGWEIRFIGGLSTSLKNKVYIIDTSLSTLQELIKRHAIHGKISSSVWTDSGIAMTILFNREESNLVMDMNASIDMMDSLIAQVSGKKINYAEEFKYLKNLLKKKDIFLLVDIEHDKEGSMEDILETKRIDLVIHEYS